jgi:heat shock protein HslJ
MLRNICVTATIVLALACARASTSATALSPGTWRLLSIGQSAALPGDVTRRPWLAFAPDSSRVSGNLGCNRTSGPFTMQGNELRFGALISTRMACADDALNRQEAALGGALQATDRYRIRGDSLDLLRGNAVVAAFVRVP